MTTRSRCFYEFLSNRAKRLLPASTFILFILIFPNIDWKVFLQNIIFLPSFFPKIPSINFVSWTLGWEWLFYISIFFILNSKFIRSRSVYIYISMLFFLLSLLFFNYFIHSRLLNYGVDMMLPDPGRFSAFFIGVFISICYQNPSYISLAKSSLLSAALIVWMLLLLSFS